MYRKLLDVKAVELKIELSYAGDEIISYFSSLIVCKEKIRKVDLKIEGSDSYYQHIFDCIGALTGLREVTAKIDNKEYEDSFQLLNKEINTPQRRKYNSDRHSNKKKEGRTIKNYNHHDFNKIPEVFKGTKAFKSNFEETEDK